MKSGEVSLYPIKFKRRLFNSVFVPMPFFLLSVTTFTNHMLLQQVAVSCLFLSTPVLNTILCNTVLYNSTPLFVCNSHTSCSLDVKKPKVDISLFDLMCLVRQEKYLTLAIKQINNTSYSYTL